MLPDQDKKAGKYHKLQNEMVLKLSWRKLITFFTYLSAKKNTKGIPYSLMFTLYGTKSSKMGTMEINKLGSSTCVNIWSTFTCIVSESEVGCL